MSDLDRDVRMLLDAAEGGHDPTAADRERVWKGVATGLAVPIAIASAKGAVAAKSLVVGTTVAQGTKVTAGFAVWGAFTAKVVGVAGVVAVASIGGAILVERANGALNANVVPAVASSTVSMKSSTAVPPPSARIEPTEPSEPLPVEALAEAPVVAGTAVPTVPHAPPRVVVVNESVSEPKASPSTLGDEAGLMRRAQESLGRGDSAASLAAIAEHAQKFESGHLAEEREAMRVLATCAAGHRDEARGLAHAFERKFSVSAHLARVRAACPESAR